MASSINPLPLPSQDPIIVLRDKRKYPDPKDKDPREGFMSQRFQEYLDRQGQTLAQSSTWAAVKDLADQSASIAATDLATSALSAGFYEVLIYATVVQAPTTSYSLKVDLDWKDRTQTKNYTGTAVTSPNSTAAILVDVVPMHIDKASPVRYTVTYSSVGATPMKYDLHLILRRVNA